MNFIINLLVLIVSLGVAGFMGFSFVLNLKRAIKVQKGMIANPKSLTGKVVDVQKTKNRYFVKVEYISPGNEGKYTEIFELTHKEFNDQYFVDQEVKIYYPDIKGLKKVNCFPVYLEGQKIKIQMGPVLMDAGMMVLEITFAYVFWWNILRVVDGANGLTWGHVRPFMTATSSFDSTSAIVSGSACVDSMFFFMALLFSFLLVFTAIDRVRGMDADSKGKYLKIYGIKNRAEVKTFKYGKNKDAAGLKEAQLKIEFRTNDGTIVNCDLSSYLYGKTEEQFINILYDELDPKNCVYVTGGKK